MFKIGDYVICSNKGVCVVENITTLNISGVDKEREYYILKPLYVGGSTVYVPVDSPRESMRKVLKKEEAEKLIEVTRKSFFQGVAKASAGKHLHDISNAIADYVIPHGYGIVHDLVGHGIGTKLHEPPNIPNFPQRRRGIRLKAGMTLAIEPMINAGTWEVEWLDDDWTVVTADGALSAHYENTVLITNGEPEIFTLNDSL